MQNTLSRTKDCQAYLNKQNYQGSLLRYTTLRRLDIVVVIPSKGEQYLSRALDSLIMAERKSFFIEIIVVINRSDNEADTEIDKLNQRSIKKCEELNKKYGKEDFQILVINSVFDNKLAGVGLARKVGMDEAVNMFLGNNNPNGIIVNFDADCLCDANFFVELKKKFVDENLDAVSVHFEHNLKEYPENEEFITAYECHLRYFIMAQRYTGHPFIFFTVGSALATRCWSYCRFGGMNKRRAGEDFYYLNKIAKFGIVEELNSARIIASSRTSDRVPFGTGRSMMESHTNEEPVKTYSFKSFILLKQLFDEVADNSLKNSNYKTVVPTLLKSFILEEEWNKSIAEIKQNTTSDHQFNRRFFQWFDAFRIMKLCNQIATHSIEKIPIHEALSELYFHLADEKFIYSPSLWLLKCRSDQKNGRYYNDT